jgi:hypothetical protein
MTIKDNSFSKPLEKNMIEMKHQERSVMLPTHTHTHTHTRMLEESS